MQITTLLKKISSMIKFGREKIRCTFESLLRRYYLTLQDEKVLNTGAGLYCMSLSKDFKRSELGF